jgi:hypothetical protein
MIARSGGRFPVLLPELDSDAVTGTKGKSAVAVSPIETVWDTDGDDVIREELGELGDRIEKNLVAMVF